MQDLSHTEPAAEVKCIQDHNLQSDTLHTRSQRKCLLLRSIFFTQTYIIKRWISKVQDGVQLGHHVHSQAWEWLMWVLRVSSTIRKTEKYSVFMHIRDRVVYPCTCPLSSNGRFSSLTQCLHVWDDGKGSFFLQQMLVNTTNLGAKESPKIITLLFSLKYMIQNPFRNFWLFLK